MDEYEDTPIRVPKSKPALPNKPNKTDPSLYWMLKLLQWAIIISCVILFVATVLFVSSKMVPKVHADEAPPPVPVLIPQDTAIPFTGGIIFDCKVHPDIPNAYLCVVRTVKYAPMPPKSF